MLAIAATVLFGIALIFELASVVIGPLDALVFITAGLLCLALQFAGVGRSRISACCLTFEAQSCNLV